MVQVSLRKVGCLVGLLVLLLTVTFFAMFTDVVCHGHAGTSRMQPDPVDVDELYRFSPPAHMVALDSAQKAELKGIYAVIVQAYSNRQVEVLREWRRKLPGRVELVSQHDLDDAECRFSTILYNEVIPELGRKKDSPAILAAYGSVGDFEQAVGTMLAFAGIYGDVRLQRKELGGRFDDLEALVVYRLVSYRDCFRDAGRTDMEKAAERFLAEWIDQIESENGYTRTRLAESIAHYRVYGDHVMREYAQTWEEVSQNAVRQFTYRLIRAGYTPKWLDEFKNIPRHATQMRSRQGREGDVR